jgi:hypothetical protein
MTMDNLKEFQQLLADHAAARQAGDRPARERSAAILAEALQRHPEWKPLAPRGVVRRSTRGR